MKLIPDAKKVARHAASVRWMVFAMVFSGAEAAVPYLYDVFGISPRVFALITFAIVALALLFRFKAQKAFDGEDE